MSAADEDKKRPNRVLQVMIAISLGIHFVIFLYIADLYHSENYRSIEIEVSDTNEMDRRVIPQPRQPHKPPEVDNVDKLDVSKQEVPRMKPEAVEDVRSPDVDMDEIAMPDTSGLSADVNEYQAAGEAPRYMSRTEYFDMLRLKIESHKQYPESAKRRQIEGRVVVEFTVLPGGKATDVHIVKSSRNDSLDRAAIDAVRNSAPFASPPSSLFSGPLQMKVTILFELT
ncbi:MAG: TonB family protein [Thermodesulfobacteriota bacterium]